MPGGQKSWVHEIRQATILAGLDWYICVDNDTEMYGPLKKVQLCYRKRC